jgi:hypothetical protein
MGGRVKIEQLHELFVEAKRITGHREFVVVGSLSVLGALDPIAVPPRMVMSNDVDTYTRNDPERIFDLQELLGEGSDFAKVKGYYLDPVSPHLPTLPDGWQDRMSRVNVEDDLVIWFLDPNDAAISKYARGEPRDREWIGAGLAAGILAPAIIESRLKKTDFLDVDEQERASRAFAEDRARSNLVAKLPRPR